MALAVTLKLYDGDVGSTLAQAAVVMSFLAEKFKIDL